MDHMTVIGYALLCTISRNKFLIRCEVVFIDCLFHWSIVSHIFRRWWHLTELFELLLSIY